MLTTTNTINNLGSSAWIAQITGYEDLIFKLTDFSIPEVNAGVTAISNRTNYVYQETGDHIQYENLSLSFLVDENLKNYRRLHEWMRDNTENGIARQESIFVHLLDNNKRFQGMEIEFIFAFPISLSKLEFDVDGNISDVTCSVTFAYTYFDFIDATKNSPLE